MKDYHINIFYSEEDLERAKPGPLGLVRGYIADVPDLQLCSAFGETPAEALAEVEQAKEAWLGAAKEAGKPVPEPRYRPAIYQLAS